MVDAKPEWERSINSNSLPEKNGEVFNECPMSVCLAPQRLQLLEDFYKEVCRIQNEESGNMRVGLALSRAIAKVINNG